MIRSLKYAVGGDRPHGPGGLRRRRRRGRFAVGKPGPASGAAGSSTVFPFATRVAETFARTSGGAAPRVESLGTGGGIQAFCQGVGPNTPDIANASRQMKQSEFDLCAKNGVKDIVEIKIGFDGIVIATARNGNGFNFELKRPLRRSGQGSARPERDLRRQSGQDLEPGQRRPAKPTHFRSMARRPPRARATPSWSWA